MGKLFYRIMVAAVLTVAVSGVAVAGFEDTPFQFREDQAKTGNATGVAIQQFNLTGDASLAFLMMGRTEWLVGIDSSEGDTFNISNATGTGAYTSTGVAITTSGNVGIGTKNPLFKLQVNTDVDRNLDLGRLPGILTNGLAIVSRNDANDALRGLELEASVYLFRAGNVSVEGAIDATDVLVDVDNDGTIDTSVGELLTRVIALEGLVSGIGGITDRLDAIEAALSKPGASGISRIQLP